MSGATARVTRREIRRAIGPDGLAAVNATSLLVHEQIGPAVHFLREAHDRQLIEHSVTGDRLTRLESDMRALQAIARASIGLSFWQRLSWLLLGRGW